MIAASRNCFSRKTADIDMIVIHRLSSLNFTRVRGRAIKSERVLLGSSREEHPKVHVPERENQEKNI